MSRSQTSSLFAGAGPLFLWLGLLVLVAPPGHHGPARPGPPGHRRPRTRPTGRGVARPRRSKPPVSVTGRWYKENVHVDAAVSMSEVGRLFRGGLAVAGLVDSSAEDSRLGGGSTLPRGSGGGLVGRLFRGGVAVGWTG